MKKALALLACLSVFCMTFFAQAFNSEDPFAEEEFYSQRTTVEVIVPENQNWEDKNASVKIEYYPMYDEAYFYYETLHVTYEKGQAMNAVKESIENFMKEKKYHYFKYIREDREQYKKAERGNKAIYISQLKFER